MKTSPARVCVVESDGRGIDCEAYKSRKEMVLVEIDRGTLGNGCHGNEAHLAALREVIARAQEVIAKIENPPAPSCNLHDDCDAADAKSMAVGRGQAVHCNDEDCEDCFGK